MAGTFFDSIAESPALLERNHHLFHPFCTGPIECVFAVVCCDPASLIVVPPPTQAGPKPAEAKVKPEHHLVKVVKKTTEPHGRDDKFAWRWLKPHPAVSSLLADSSRQYM